MSDKVSAENKYNRDYQLNMMRYIRKERALPRDPHFENLERLYREFSDKLNSYINKYMCEIVKQSGLKISFTEYYRLLKYCDVKSVIAPQLRTIKENAHIIKEQKLIIDTKNAPWTESL